MDCGGPCPPCANAPKTMRLDNSLLSKQNWYVASETLSTEGQLHLADREFPYELIAGEEVVLNEGFSVSDNADLSIRIDSDPSNFVRQFSHVCHHVHNVITPNGDGVNDFWVATLVGYLHLEVEIEDVKGTLYHRGKQDLDRDGNIVLWDGMRNGKRVPAGAYFWYMELRDFKGKARNLSGSLTVLYDD